MTILIAQLHVEYLRKNRVILRNVGRRERNGNNVEVWVCDAIQINPFLLYWPERNIFWHRCEFWLLAWILEGRKFLSGGLKLWSIYEFLSQGSKFSRGFERNGFPTSAYPDFCRLKCDTKVEKTEILKSIRLRGQSFGNNLKKVFKQKFDPDGNFRLNRIESKIFKVFV